MTKTGKIIISVSVVAALAIAYVKTNDTNNPISNTVSEVKQEIINKAVKAINKFFIS